MADGTLKVGTITTSSGSGTITLGQSGETVDMANGSITLNSSMKMTPAFHANLSAGQSISDNSLTKVQFNTEVFDTDSCYDNSTNYRFTPQVAGKYYVYGGVRGFAGGSDPDGVRIITLGFYKNGSSVRDYTGFDSDPNEMRHMEVTASTVIELNGSTDYLELYGKVYAENLSSTGVVLNGNQTYFGAYRIGA